MSDSVSSESSVPSPTAPASPTSTAAAASAASSSGYTASTHISSLEDLKKKAPEVYNQTLKSIGMKVCNDMKRHQDQLKETIRRGYQNN